MKLDEAAPYRIAEQARLDHIDAAAIMADMERGDVIRGGSQRRGSTGEKPLILMTDDPELLIGGEEDHQAAGLEEQPPEMTATISRFRQGHRTTVFSMSKEQACGT